MRKTVRLMSEKGPEQRLAEAVGRLPEPVRGVLGHVAERTDLPLVAGSWRSGDSGCLVANVVSSLAPTAQAGDDERTLDLRILELVPELSSRDLNLLIVAWDEAAEQAGVATDAGLRDLLRGALRRAGVTPTGTGAGRGMGPALVPDAAPGTVTAPQGASVTDVEPPVRPRLPLGV